MSHPSRNSFFDEHIKKTGLTPRQAARAGTAVTPAPIEPAPTPSRQATQKRLELTIAVIGYHLFRFREKNPEEIQYQTFVKTMDRQQQVGELCTWHTLTSEEQEELEILSEKLDAVISGEYLEYEHVVQVCLAAFEKLKVRHWQGMSWIHSSGRISELDISLLWTNGAVNQKALDDLYSQVARILKRFIDSPQKTMVIPCTLFLATSLQTSLNWYKDHHKDGVQFPQAEDLLTKAMEKLLSRDGGGVISMAVEVSRKERIYICKLESTMQEVLTKGL
ncbi:hypothetical protein T439DRAFT_352486 [Meredithblackwellia eburnea MCA 4105]